MKTKPLSARGRSRKGRDTILRLFDGLPVVDAKRTLKITPLAVDIRGAKPKDPANCVLARACRRMFGTRRILFWRSVAYVELPDERGNLRVERYVFNTPTRESIAEFDINHKADPAGYTLLPPARGSTLDYKKRYQRDWMRQPKNPNSKKKLQVTGNLKVRDGHGQVHFEKARVKA